MKRYIITWAQNDTPAHEKFWLALHHVPGEIKVVRGFYRNPTSLFEAFKEDEISWDPRVEPYLVDHREVLLDGKLDLFANIRTQPTASRPLTGLEVYAGRTSGIVGHPKRAFVTVPTATRMPRTLMTTGACTIANYSKSNAGAKGTAHHIIGALIIEVDGDLFFPRQITWDEETESFTDLDVRYFAHGYAKAPPALSMVNGDVHAGLEDPLAIQACDAQSTLLRPQHVVWHDFFDNGTRNHHNAKDLKIAYENRSELVEDEVVYAADLLCDRVIAQPWALHHVARSNHDEALDRWMQEHDPRKDPHNTPYWHRLWARAYARYEHTNEWPDAFPNEMVRLARSMYPELKKVHFLKRNEELRIGNVQCGFHGHSGINGSRGSNLAYTKLGVKVSKAHDHAPFIGDGTYSAGHNSRPDHGYNNLPNGWLQANILQYADGKRTINITINGRWRGEGKVENAVPQRSNRSVSSNRARVRNHRRSKA